MQKTQGKMESEPVWLSDFRQKNREWQQNFSSSKKTYFFSPRSALDSTQVGTGFVACTLPSHLQKSGVRVLDWPSALRDDSLSLKDWFERFAIPSSKAEAFVNAHFNSGFVLVVDHTSDVSKVLEWSVEAGPDAVCKVLVVVKEGVQNALLLERLMGRVPLWASLSLVVEQDANATVLRLFDLDADS
ncbi:MAG: hypothetical protein Q7R47_00575, partial [Candidatus Diapherotrites archaeon]|nr:hypothetical protein [Candidatus Diapherotrites archaeon]